jgi:DNA-binding MarR family transcriptional regulator
VTGQRAQHLAPARDAGRPPEGDYECARAWAALTAAHARIAGRLSAALARACDLTINDFEILLRVDRAPKDGVRLGELLSAVPLTQPALSRAVARLGERGCLSRAGAPGDRRGVLITITPAGRDLLAEAVPVHAATIRETLLDRLSPAEQDVLARVLSRSRPTRPPLASAHINGLPAAGAHWHPPRAGQEAEETQ